MCGEEKYSFVTVMNLRRLIIGLNMEFVSYICQLENNIENLESLFSS